MLLVILLLRDVLILNQITYMPIYKYILFKIKLR